MIFLLEMCSLDIPHSVLLKSFSSLVELLKSLSSDTGDIFSKVRLLYSGPGDSQVLKSAL